VRANSTVEGQILPGQDMDRDFYRVDVQQGQRTSVEVEAARLGTLHLGGENDLEALILDSAGKELARNDDSALYVQDPVVSVMAPRGGSYYVEIRQQIFYPPRQAWYRAHIGTFSRPTAIFPAGGQAGSTIEARVLGDPAGERTERIALPAKPGNVEYFTPVDTPPSGNMLRVSAYPNVIWGGGGAEWDSDESGRDADVPVCGKEGAGVEGAGVRAHAGRAGGCAYLDSGGGHYKKPGGGGRCQVAGPGAAVFARLLVHQGSAGPGSGVPAAGRWGVRNRDRRYGRRRGAGPRVPDRDRAGARHDLYAHHVAGFLPESAVRGADCAARRAVDGGRAVGARDWERLQGRDRAGGGRAAAGRDDDGAAVHARGDAHAGGIRGGGGCAAAGGPDRAAGAAGGQGGEAGERIAAGIRADQSRRRDAVALRVSGPL